MLITMILCVVVLFPSNKKQSPKEEFQLGQAHHNYSVPTPNSQSSIHSTATDVESVEMVLDDARKEIKLTEKEQLAQLEKTVDTTTTSITNQLRIGMGRLFGSALSSEEVESVATQVQAKLTSEAKTTLRGKADQLTNTAIHKMESKASSEERNGYGAQEIEEDVYDEEVQAVSSIKSGIKAEAKQVQQSLSARAAEIEKAILEERLSAKLGKRVKLVIEENEVTPEDDELFQGISALTKPSSSSASKGSAVLPSGTSSSSIGSSTRPSTTTTTTSTGFPTTTTNKFPSTISSKNVTKTTTGAATTSIKSPTTTTTSTAAKGTSATTTTKVTPATTVNAKPKTTMIDTTKDGKRNGKKMDRKKKGKIP